MIFRGIIELVILVSLNFSQSAKMTCGGEYVNVKKDNLPCQKSLEAISEVNSNILIFCIYQTRILGFLYIHFCFIRFLLMCCFWQRINNINMQHILEPNCPKDEFLFNYTTDPRILREKYREVFYGPLQILQFGCRVIPDFSISYPRLFNFGINVPY